MFSGDNAPGIDLSQINYIYPVLVFLDNAFTSPYLDDLYNEKFDRRGLRVKGKPAVTPLFSIALDDLENCLPYTAEHSLAEILDSYTKYNRNCHPEERQFRIPILYGKKRGVDITARRFEQFGRDLQARRFSSVVPVQEGTDVGETPEARML
jgi:hypothetical protein